MYPQILPTHHYKKRGLAAYNYIHHMLMQNSGQFHSEIRTPEKPYLFISLDLKVCAHTLETAVVRDVGSH